MIIIIRLVYIKPIRKTSVFAMLNGQNTIETPSRMLDNQSKLHKVCIFIITALLFYDFMKWSSRKQFIVPNHRFSLLEPANYPLLPIEDASNQLIDLKEFSFIANPKPCQNYPAGLFLVILVNSNPIHFENRAIIRRTWGLSSDSIKVVFILGQTTNNTTQIVKNLECEISTHEDIIMGNFVDAYRNITYKHVMALKWVTHHCPSAKYVLKTDDDTVINTNMLVKFLSRELSPWGAKDLILCDVIYDGIVFRKNSKWIVTSEEYQGDHYPDYCRGFAIIYSQDVIPRLLKAAQRTPYFWIDDVHVTGTLARNQNIHLTSLGGLVLTNNNMILDFSWGGKRARPILFGSWELSVRKMVQVWGILNRDWK